MMRLVQRGEASAPLVVGWLVGPHLDAELRAILPGASIAMSATATIGASKADLARARAITGSTGPLVVVGYSAGCQLVRELALAREPAIAWVAVDGTHASLPPKPWQIDVWQRLAVEARRGGATLVLTATQQTYVEDLPSGAFLSTRTVVDRVLGSPLIPGAEIHDGALHAYSVPSARIDADAHRRQQTEWLPRVLRAHVAPLLAREEAPTLATPPEAAATLGVRLIAWMRAEAARGVREDPPGSNTSPRIREYLSACRRRGTEQPLGITAGAWCAAMVSCGLREVARGGEPYPAPRAAGVELRDDARENGTWVDPSVKPEPGWIAILHRDGPAWASHTCVVLEAREDGYRTIGGNEGDRIRETERRYGDGCYGWIRIG